MAQNNVLHIRQPINQQIARRTQFYRWTERHDPDVEAIIDIIAESGLGIGEILERVLDASNGEVHLSYATIDNWLTGKTKRPQNFTLNWVARALGYERKWSHTKRRNNLSRSSNRSKHA